MTKLDELHSLKPCTYIYERVNRLLRELAQLLAPIDYQRDEVRAPDELAKHLLVLRWIEGRTATHRELTEPREEVMVPAPCE
jgi:hypothetical protein